MLMDPKDTANPSSNPPFEIAAGEIPQPPPTEKSPEASLPNMEDTVVVPPPPTTSGAPPTTEQNPFIPNISVPGGASGTPPATTVNPLPRRLLIIGVVVLFLIGGFFAWRTVSGLTTSPPPTAGGSTGTTSGKKVTINYWGLWENDAVTRQFLSDFQAKYPNITVQYTQQSPQQYRQRLQAAIDRGEGPDVFRFHNTWIPMIHTELATVPPSVMSVAEFNSTFFPVVSNNLVAGSSIYGIPLEIDGLGLYINDDLFQTAGVQPPTTWTDVQNLVPKLTVKNGTAIVTSAIALGTASNVEHFSDILGLLFYQNGADLTNLSGTVAEQTMTFYRSFADPSNPMYTWSDGMDNSVAAFAAGRVAMILAPSWRAHDVAAINPKMHFHIAPVPQLQGNTVAWASYWVEGVSSKSKNQDAAWTFVQYMTSKEGASKLYTEESKTRLFGEPYARIDLANTIQNDPYTGAFVKQALYARSFPIASRTFDAGLNDRLIQYLTNAVNGMAQGTSATQVLQTVNAGFKQVFTDYGLSIAQPATPTP